MRRRPFRRFRPLGTSAGILAAALITGRGLAGAAPAEAPDRLIEELAHPDPFISEQAAAEFRKQGTDVLPALARFLDSPDVELRLRVDRLFGELIDLFFLELENEYRALELDRRELATLRRREEARADLERLRKVVEEWRRTQPELERKLEDVIAFRALEMKRRLSPESELDPADEERLGELRRDVERHEKEIPDLEEKVRDLARFYQLRALGQSLIDLREVEELRIEDLSERVKEREPAVERLLEELRGIGTPACTAMAARRPHMPLRDMPEENDLRSPVQILYDRLLADARKGLEEREWKPEEEDFDRQRYRLGLLWAQEVERGGDRTGEAKALLSRHLKATVRDLEAPFGPLRERAALELFYLGNRGLEALEESLGISDAVEIDPAAGRLAFLANLLRWRISPSTYAKVDIHFADYRKLPFTARRRRVFQYARAAGREAIPTLRAIVVDDTLESSFLVKYAAAKALSAQLDDRLGYLVLKSLYPDMLMKRPEISRDLRIIQGEKYMEAKEYKQAIDEFSRILDEFPFDFEGNYRIALAYLLAKNYPRSIHHFEIARRINPNDALTLYNLACAYSLGEKPKKAIEALKSSVESGFDDAEHMEKDPDLDPIRDLPGFKEVLERARASRN